jgi:immunity protein 7 of polymorphic toxin system
MLEVHGWATIWFTPENRDRENEQALQETAVERVETYVRELGWGHNPWVGFRRVNGQAHVRADGITTHSANVREPLLDVFRYIAQVAPGSYGLVYLRDDEEDPGHEQEFRVYVLARGELTEQADPFLTPFQPVVEDPPGDD